LLSAPGSRAKRNSPAIREQVDLLLLGGVDLGLAGLILVVPFIMGGRQALGQLVLTSLAVWIALCWCLRQSLASRAGWTRSWAAPLLLAALAWVGLQLVPLPAGVLNWISPHLYQTLPLWAPDADTPASLGVWSTLSLTPSATRQGLTLLLAFSLLFLVTLQRVREVADVERLLRWVALSASVMAVFGLVQFLTSNGKFFWFYEHPYSTPEDFVKGAFTNRNHFAHFVALGIGPLIWWIQSELHAGRGRRRFGNHAGTSNLKTGLRFLVLGICVFAVLLSLSRGGALALLAVATVSMLLLYRGSLIGGKTLLAVAGVGLLVGVGLCIFGYDLVTSRLDDFKSVEDLDRNSGRRSLWAADLRGAADYWTAGTGLGSHREVYPMYLEELVDSGLEFTHAENGPVQVALETGAPGLLLVLIAVGLFLYWCLASLRRGVSTRVLCCFAAIAPCLAASLTHTMLDFVWYVPGCMVIVVALGACACRLWHLERAAAGNETPVFLLPRPVWLAAVLAMAVIGGFVVRDQLGAVRAAPHWHRYLALDKTLLGNEEIPRTETLAALEQELDSVLAERPQWARAHARMASVHLRSFNEAQLSAGNSFDLRQIRDAAVASGFESSAALHEWLSRAIGAHRRHLDAALYHARQAVSLGPLQGEAYIFLAELSFLEGPNSPGTAAYVAQAFKVRPFDGAVLFEVGNEAALADDFPRAYEHWSTSFRAGWIHQRRLLDMLAGQVPVSLLLETFQPDQTALKHMAAYYRQLDRPEELNVLLACYARACENHARQERGEPVAQDWVEAGEAYRQLNDNAQGLRCLRNAVRCESTHYIARRALGRCLFDLEDYAEAEEHLKWCARRNLQDQTVQTLLERAVDKRLRQAGETPRAPETRLSRRPPRP
jgi:O-antigen ligase/tetratricopeptide (TPR) repeat protein